MRHLTVQQANAALRRGAGVEQMLSESLDGAPIRWLSAHGADGRFALRIHQVQDEGSAELLDVSVFTPVDDGEDLGEGRLIGEYGEAEDLMAAAIISGGRPDRWVNEGLIQDEYADLRRATER